MTPRRPSRSIPVHHENEPGNGQGAPIYGEERDGDERDRCAVCAVPLELWSPALYGFFHDDPIDQWSFCDDCYRLLIETIRVEIEHGPGTPPPEAWTRVRKLRAARRRRWGKVDR